MLIKVYPGFLLFEQVTYFTALTPVAQGQLHELWSLISRHHAVALHAMTVQFTRKENFFGTTLNAAVRFPATQWWHSALDLFYKWRRESLFGEQHRVAPPCTGTLHCLTRPVRTQLSDIKNKITSPRPGSRNNSANAKFLRCLIVAQ